MYAGSFERLGKIMDLLRTQCPWDAKQDIHTLRPLSIEEIYELADAIDNKDWNGIKEELGDMLLHIFFYVRLAREQEQFAMSDVIDSICNKLVHRHPHIFANVQVANEEDVKRNWEQLKLKEGKKSLLSGVPKGLPAMVKALRVQEKVKQVGFEWDTIDQVKEKVDEEMQELADEINVAVPEQHKIEDEFGDVLFSLVNYARFLKLDPEQALEKTNKKFIARFQLLEQEAEILGKQLADMTLQEMDDLWNIIKKRGV
jgi:MazG family protein